MTKVIGIDASRAFQKQRTGIEEYSYQVIRHLGKYLKDDQVVLYVSPTNYPPRVDEQASSRVEAGESCTNIRITNDLNIPKKWEIKIIRWPRFWTQIGLSLELLFHPVDVLFVPGHTVPLIHPRNTIVTVHGLEYEIFPEGYSFWERFYMRLSIKNSCRWAKKIISVSKNTKKDLMRLYNIPEQKIEVIYEGVNRFESTNECESTNLRIMPNEKIMLFVGRLEERKNVINIVRAFEILKEHYKIPHKLILAGKLGYGKEKIKKEIKNINHASDIILPGFVPDEDKEALMRGADVFLFPTLYEGFGIPVLEAQALGVPVVASNNSSIPEVAGNSAILVDPNNAEEIADATYRLISDKALRDGIIEKGYENVKRFSWDKCAEEIAKIL